MRNKKNFLEGHKNQVIEWSKAGVNNAEIGRRLGCGGNIVGIFLKKYGVYSQQLPVDNMNKYREEIENRFNSGESFYAISKDLALDLHTLLKYAKRWGLDTSKNARFYKHGSLVDKTDSIVKMYKDGLNINRIAAILECCSSGVAEILKKNGIKLDRNGTLEKINLSYFEKVDTPNKAYILGFLYADGNVSKDLKTWKLALKYDDEEVLLRMKEELEYSGDLKYAIRTKGSPQYTLCVNKKKMCEDLVKLGCMPQKTFKLRFPNDDQVPKYLLNHFIRGYFGGDGSASWTNRNKCCSFIGNLDFIKELAKVLPCEITNVYQAKNGSNPDTPELCAHKLLIGRKLEALKALSWMYAPCEDDPALLCLSRKFAIYKKAIGLKL